MESDNNKETGLEENKKYSLHKEIKEWARSIILAVALAVIIRMFFLEVFLVEGTSMFPTLHHHERLIVNKATYYLSKPEKGDIIVFNFSPRRDFIKRVIALEGDVVELIGGCLYINNELVNEPFVENHSMTDFGPIVVPEGHAFVLGDNRSNSMDSRDSAVGCVSLEKVKGKAFLVFWPPFNARLL
ncbi:MAG TPA: signal peptidase I [Firmicutes bacterium]|jgi:signal peptidase I|nr:signal peptidase I [Bacillota bacterium]